MVMTEPRFKAAAGLVVLATVIAATLAGLQSVTEGRIIVNESARTLALLDTVLPPGSYDNAPQLDLILIDAPVLGGDSLPVYRARLDGRAAAAVLTVIAPDGYVDAIRLLVGIDASGRITGVRAVSHGETPGLGDGIDIRKSDWIRQFDGQGGPQATQQAWALRRDGGDYDQLTGATITSRAVVKAVGRAADYFSTHRDQLLGTADSQASP